MAEEVSDSSGRNKVPHRPLTSVLSSRVLIDGVRFVWQVNVLQAEIIHGTGHALALCASSGDFRFFGSDIILENRSLKSLMWADLECSPPTIECPKLNATWMRVVSVAGISANLLSLFLAHAALCWSNWNGHSDKWNIDHHRLTAGAGVKAARLLYGFHRHLPNADGEALDRAPRSWDIGSALPPLAGVCVERVTEQSAKKTR